MSTYASILAGQSGDWNNSNQSKKLDNLGESYCFEFFRVLDLRDLIYYLVVFKMRAFFPHISII